MSGNVGEDVKEVGRCVDTIDSDDGRDGRNAVTFGGGAGAIERAWVIPSIVGAIEKVLDDLVGGGDVQLVNVVNLGPRDGGEGGGGDGSGGERRRRHWVQLASLKRLF